jgi:hypothetical protein
MKKITFLCLMLSISLVGFAQEVVQDFESSPPIAGFEGLASATIVPDPSTAGNGQVLELVTSVTGNPWQGAEVILADDSALDLTSNLTVSVDVWSTVAFSPMLKVETTGSAAAAPNAANTQSHTGSGWETLTYTLNTGDDGTQTANGIYNKVVFFPNRSSDGSAWNTPVDGTFYFDNIFGVKGTIAGEVFTPPSTAAPTPSALPANEVISFYSDAFTQRPLNFDAGFCGIQSVEEIQVEGNNTMWYRSNACQGIQLNTPVDASTFTTLHFDFWVEPGTDLLGSVISLKFNETNGDGPADDVFLDIVLTEASVPAIVTGEWVSVERAVDLSNFDALDEFVITAGTLGNRMYYDNLYLSGGVLSTNDFALDNLQIFPNPSKNDWNVKTSNGQNIISVQVYDILGKQVLNAFPNASEFSINASGLKDGIYMAKITSDKGSKTIKLVKN